MSEIVFQKAERKKAKVKVSIGGPAGSGKSYSALRLASGIAKKMGSRVAMIGTEKGRNEYYSDEFDYDVLNLDPPYSPERYIAAIQAAEQAGYKVCIIDSATHEWHGEGGILDIKSNMPGNDFAKWDKLTPRHNAFIETLTSCDMHIILTARGKDQYVVEMNDKGKQVPKKIGVGIDQREGLEYECTIAFLLDMDHKAQTQKDNTRIFDGQYFLLTEEHGEKIYEWAEQGKTFIKDLPRNKDKKQNTSTTPDNNGEEKEIVKKPRQFDSWGKPIGDFLALTQKELDRIFTVCKVTPAQKQATIEQLKKRQTEEPTVYRQQVDGYRELYHSIIKLDELIIQLPIEHRQKWIDEKERCVKVSEYQEACILLEDELQMLKAPKVNYVEVDNPALKVNPHSEANTGLPNKIKVAVPVDNKELNSQEAGQ